MHTLEGSDKAKGFRFAIVVARFNDFITDRLLAGALEALSSAEIASDDVTVLRVPGSYEIPIAAQRAAETGRFDGVICLGCVIRGETPHFEYIAQAVSHGLTHAAAATGVPMAFGVLTTNSAEEALARVPAGPGNKGWEAAMAGVEMATLHRAARRRTTRRPAVIDSGTGWQWARQSRDVAIQMLYQWEVGRLSVPEVAESFWRIGEIDESIPERARERAAELVRGTVEQVGRIDRILEEASRNWRLDRMPVIDRLILRLGIYELLHDPDTPPAVVIDEAIELARRFSTEEAVPFVNGVLDAVKDRIERGEIAAGPAAS